MNRREVPKQVFFPREKKRFEEYTDVGYALQLMTTELLKREERIAHLLEHCAMKSELGKKRFTELSAKYNQIGEILVWLENFDADRRDYLEKKASGKAKYFIKTDSSFEEI